ncbi:MAG TPA: alcohol dehydrogenase catalytic domain-containing protein [Actinomycetota bacterium]|nr:alcohol dehydrogenase catalytic domain-containing protein [Actinomycetota bacterium]
MRAILFDDVGLISFGDYPEPSVQDPGDAVIKITTAAICGSDLHLLHGKIPGLRPGSVIGHEFVGIVESVGAGVKRFKAGDRVVGSFMIACGACWACERGDYNLCEDMWVLGYGMFVGDLDGAQAEYVRIPKADLNLHAIDPGMTDEQAIFAGDILSTAGYITSRAEIQEGDTVAITGAGPVGLFSLMHAMTYNPSRVYVVDQAEDRLKLAESLGATPIDMTKVNPVVALQRETGERGVDVVIEAVGATPALTTALNAVRPGGTVAVIGVYTDLSWDFPLGEVFRRAIRLEFGGSANVQGHWTRSLQLVQQGVIDPTVIITHTLPLDEGLRGYELFESREALKVVLKP